MSLDFYLGVGSSLIFLYVFWLRRCSAFSIYSSLFSTTKATSFVCGQDYSIIIMLQFLDGLEFIFGNI